MMGGREPFQVPNLDNILRQKPDTFFTNFEWYLGQKSCFNIRCRIYAVDYSINGLKPRPLSHIHIQRHSSGNFLRAFWWGVRSLTTFFWARPNIILNISKQHLSFFIIDQLTPLNTAVRVHNIYSLCNDLIPS
jgi:hypothetical protein